MANSVFITPNGFTNNGSQILPPLPIALSSGTVGAPGITFVGDTTTGWFKGGSGEWFFSSNGVLKAVMRTGGILLDSGVALSWNDDLYVSRSAANVLNQVNGTVTQQFFVGATNATGIVRFGSFLFANIATVLSADGMVGYCSDCTIANPCAGGGNGAIAKRLNGQQVCN